MNAKPRLELRGLHKSFDGTKAVNGIDLAVAPGEFLSLLGPSGCGKSTLLSMITGLTVPDAGDIIADGRVVNDVAPQHRRLGLVFQDYAVFSRLTVQHNLAFGLKARGLRRAECDEKVAAIARQFDLEALLPRSGATLNMSEMQRVAIARVLVTEPDILLLDEPMSNLDAAVRIALRTELKQIQTTLKQTILYVTHDQAEAMAMSDRIAVMDAGKLLQIGSPEDIYRRPSTRFVAEFIGDPPMNLLACSLRQDGGEWAVSTALHGPMAVGACRFDAAPACLGIRPHDVRLADPASPGAAATTVVYLENIGAEHIAYVAYGDALLALATRPDTVREGDTVGIALDPKAFHFILADGVVVHPQASGHQHG